MIDIKPFVAEKLKSVARVELSFNDCFHSLPVIVMTETGNEARIVIGDSDRVSRITVQLDVYAGTVRETEEVACRVNSVMTGTGFRRSFSELITDEEKPRRCMRFTCGIDEANGRILTL